MTRNCAYPQRPALVYASGDSHRTGDGQRCIPETHKKRSLRLTTKDVSRRITSTASTNDSPQSSFILCIYPCQPHSASGLIDGIIHQPRPPHHLDASRRITSAISLAFTKASNKVCPLLYIWLCQIHFVSGYIFGFLTQLVEKGRC